MTQIANSYRVILSQLQTGVRIRSLQFIKNKEGNVMIANYHTHTPRCGHACGQEIEYVENALKAGLQILGFSDHTPQFFPGNHYSNMRMRPHLLQEYIDAVMQLKQDYAGKLQIHLGLEVEYYPAIFPKLVEVLKDTPVEYMLLGQHWNGNEENEPYNGRPTEDEALLERHCNQVIDAMHTGAFTYLAHPDILNFVGDPKVYQRHMRRLCQAANSCHIPLEMNFIGLRDGRQYPNPLFWEVAAEEGCQSILGVDAHSPEQLLDTETERKANALLAQLGMQVVETVELKKF